MNLVLLAIKNAMLIQQQAAASQQFAESMNLMAREIGRVFGPEGVGRMVRLVFTDEERQVDDPASVIGIGRQRDRSDQGGTGRGHPGSSHRRRCERAACDGSCACEASRRFGG